MWDVQGREPYWDEIRSGIVACSHFLFAISPDSLKPSSGALKGLYHAVQPELDKIIVPILVKAIPIPFSDLPIPISAGRLYIHNFVTGDYADMMARVIHALIATTPAVGGPSGQ